MVAPQMTLGAGVFLFLAGAFVWTLTEYLLHRFAFHYEPRTEWGKKVHFVFHGVHHDYPNDSRRLVMAPVVSIPLAIIFYGFFHFLLGPVRVLAFFPGFLMGYICYDTIHYATHHFPMRNPIGLWLRHHHLRHHYQDDAYGYGVSTPLWDYVFRTTHRPKPEPQPASQHAETVS
jgi:sterol desaturase/sphingolipid hydroxylase (fatty acid hydroxylase superfamily)